MITGIVWDYERSVNHLERADKHDGRPEADALKEGVRVDMVTPSVNGSKDGKEKAIGLAIAQIERQFGKGAIMRLGAQPTALDIAVISTGAISLDAALGVGGIPRGRVTEIFGPEASGKTTPVCCTSSPRCSRRAALRPSSMPSTRWTRPTPAGWG